MDLSGFASFYKPKIQADLDAVLGAFQVNELRSACAHLLGLGKLFRPLLALATYQACGGGRAEDIIRFVSPLELVHTFSLIHDDLPCMDDALTRRGKPSVHITHGEAIAVLAGDALLNLAMLRLVQVPGKVSAKQRVKLVDAVTRAMHDVSEGQVLDLLGEGQQWDRAQLERLHRLKTGALLGACCEFGAILAGAHEEQLHKLSSLGVNIGLAFQMRDDLLSMTSTDEAMGKTLATDEAKEKATYARLLGKAQAELLLKELTAENVKSINALGLPEPGLLAEIAAAADNRKN